jgi:hypothetical protein
MGFQESRVRRSKSDSKAFGDSFAVRSKAKRKKSVITQSRIDAEKNPI